METISMFELLSPTYKIDKPIRLIELFAGVGSQAMALRNIGADFEHYRVVEFDKYAIQSYNAIHSTNFPTMDITQTTADDLSITETDKYTYIMTYSFPCQDLSLAGKRRGMEKGSGTRSGLLWEVERLLNETEELPQVLLMENVPQVIGEENIRDFREWQFFLEELGYSNFVSVLNAKDYGVAQNRNRAFMVSILGDWHYKFPNTVPLEKRMKDYLQDEVDEKYYITGEKADKLIQQLIKTGLIHKTVCEERVDEGLRTFESDVIGALRTKDSGGDKRVIEAEAITVSISEQGNKIDKEIDCALTLMARDYKGFGNQGSNAVVSRIGNIYGEDKGTGFAGNVWYKEGLCPTITTMQGGGREPMIVASRGRNPKNPSDRTTGTETEQRLEPNSQGICNTLTSVQKDNLVLEPAILTQKRTEYGKSIRKDYESGKVQESRHNMTELRPREDGISNTLTTVQKDNYLLEPIKIRQATKQGYIECNPGGVADLSYPTSNTRRGRVEENGEVSPTLTATGDAIHRIETRHRIRKLTPLECWRLMGFTDEDFYRAEQVNSNSQLYKQAGNSIVVDVLEAIFSKMI